MSDFKPRILEAAADPSRKRTIVPLDGVWELAPGTREVLPAHYPHRIRVPSVVDTAVPALAWEAEDHFYYRLAFRIAGLDDSSIVLLHIDQAQFGTTVSLNGSVAGESIACYTSQEYRLEHLLHRGEVNELVIRVGARRTLPSHSAVGRDLEKEIYTPGIWGKLSLICTHEPFIRSIQVIPQLARNAAVVKVAVSRGIGSDPATVRIRVRERAGGKLVSEWSWAGGSKDKGSVVAEVPIRNCRLWSPEDPFLYVAEVETGAGGLGDSAEATFGMREFSIVNGQFHLNGRRILLRGGNIAFHRFLADPERKELPWDPDWVRTVLVEIPRAHHFNFFRMHLGHAPNFWYDIADENGILIQDEWHFWGTTGTDTQIREEFSRWLRDNWNHPSIIIWDPLNESSDATLQREIVPEMKLLDPTRPWETVDFRDQHPYIYSLCMTYADRPMGFTDALDEIAKSARPKVVNEFLWWWFDSTWKPTVLMEGVVERWLGRSPRQEDIVAHLRFLATELVELFRRLGADAIQPFVYLSNNTGPTAHWFEGPVAKLRPKPVLAALRNAFAPFGVSLELWDRHFGPGQTIETRAFVFNDTQQPRGGMVQIRFNRSDQEAGTPLERPVFVPPTDRQIADLRLEAPAVPGTYTLMCELLDAEGRTCAVSEKQVFVIPPPRVPQGVRDRTVWLEDPSDEVGHFLRTNCVAPRTPSKGSFRGGDIIFINAPAASSHDVKNIGAFVRSGGTVVLQEPEYRVVDDREVLLLPELRLTVKRRHDVDKGGYDSYVFPEDPEHPLWNSIPTSHLRIWNGGVGGEMVSEYSVESSLPTRVLASCGLGLRVPAVFEVPVGRGRVLVSRIQIRGRLGAPSVGGPLFGRRADPVAKQYLLNLLAQ